MAVKFLRLKHNILRVSPDPCSLIGSLDCETHTIILSTSNLHTTKECGDDLIRMYSQTAGWKADDDGGGIGVHPDV